MAHLQRGRDQNTQTPESGENNENRVDAFIAFHGVPHVIIVSIAIFVKKSGDRNLASQTRLRYFCRHEFHFN